MVNFTFSLVVEPVGILLFLASLCDKGNFTSTQRNKGE